MTFFNMLSLALFVMVNLADVSHVYYPLSLILKQAIVTPAHTPFLSGFAISGQAPQ